MVAAEITVVSPPLLMLIPVLEELMVMPVAEVEVFQSLGSLLAVRKRAIYVMPVSGLP